jgi:phosphoribosylanthranilate isomerase
MFRVKICGVTNTPDALAAVAAGADAIGLNFYAGSPRHCSPETARQVAAALPSHVCRVGVFVNASPEEIRAIARAVPLDAVQLHGDEPPELLAAVAPWPVIRASRADGDYAAIGAYLDACHRLRAMPRMLLVDAPPKAGSSGQPASGPQYGGTGTALDWHALAAARAQLGGVPLVLAGGLTPENVAAAIAAVRPWAVDVASGVEDRPGQKSAAKLQAFVAAALAAFAVRPR